jgi:hypothetical protein
LGLNILPIFMSFFSRRFAMIGLLVVATLIIPYQLFLGVRWWRVHREAERIVTYVQTTMAATNQPPANLNGYAFRDPSTAAFIGYSPTAGNSFRVDYWIGTPTTSHWFDRSAGWLYYAD